MVVIVIIVIFVLGMIRFSGRFGGDRRGRSWDGSRDGGDHSRGGGGGGVLEAVVLAEDGNTLHCIPVCTRR